MHKENLYLALTAVGVLTIVDYGCAKALSQRHAYQGGITQIIASEVVSGGLKSAWGAPAPKRVRRSCHPAFAPHALLVRCAAACSFSAARASWAIGVAGAIGHQRLRQAMFHVAQVSVCVKNRSANVKVSPTRFSWPR